MIMHDCIETYCDLFADDLERRLGITDDKLPPSLAVTTLLNPIFGLESKVVGTGLMTESQYKHARKSIISLMHDILDRNTVIIVESCSSGDDDSDDEVLEPTGNANYNRAVDEFSAFERFKKKKYLPVLKKTQQGSLSNNSGDESTMKELFVGPVVSKGKDLPSGKNLADYVDQFGRMDLLCLFEHHKKIFPTLWILVQKFSSVRVVEVGCERFFGLSGYVSAPRRTRLGVRHYERLAMLSSIINKIYIDPEVIATNTCVGVVSRNGGGIG
jgi:hypothetical protein